MKKSIKKKLKKKMLKKKLKKWEKKRENSYVSVVFRGCRRSNVCKSGKWNWDLNPVLYFVSKWHSFIILRKSILQPDKLK